MANKRISVICGTGVATSTVIVTKVKDFLKEKGLVADIQQGKVSDLVTGGTTADFIIATTHIPDSITVPVVPGLPFLTGMGLDKTYDRIEELMNS
ncbi:MAG: PTS sugar transporter subunit IIB [Microbacteriaceae bacterium]